ncbi:S41 family peptidase [Acetohalobium arabaticum]|uniref:Carboxyl-terminal protease n=1 Tax=Acetohalobium arabaticum (strain ATCC 49924 / DSM 5501 / Z-7288) TaxID=574087 RepID=D9QU41_ACEAZ|nr:S41 family peptidase [Acetohalobium arabaticum]ADL11834.1 carboxyl-terminal protease [Acetohalobium arabaticum DSM 5501]
MFKRWGKLVGIVTLITLILGAGVLGFFIRGVQADDYLLAEEMPQKFKIFENVLTIVQRYYVKEVELDKLLTGAIKGMLNSLEDPYTRYLSKEDYEDMQMNFEGEFGGIGIVVTMRHEELTIVSPIEGTPGSKADLQAGDIITQIDGESTEGMTIKKAVSLMKGEPGTEVILTIEREKDEEKEPEVIEVSITRAMIEVPYVESEIKEEGIGYIRIAQFAEEVGADVQQELKKLEEQNAEAVILDLRNNPGGMLKEAVKVASSFIPNGPVVHIKERNGEQETLLVSSEIKPSEHPLVVLVNEGSASASEIIAGAVQDTDNGVVMGNQTFGKGVVQSVIPLDDGSALKLTTARYYTPDERYINETGIEPDIKVEYDPDDTEQDEQLQRAIKYLKKKIKEQQEELKPAS